MAFDRAAAKEAGYSDDEIDAYIAANPHVETKKDKDQQQATKLPSPEEVLGTSATNPSDNLDRTNEDLMTGAMGVGLGAAGVGVPAALYYGGKAILNPAVRAGVDFAQRGVGALENANKIAQATEQRVAANQAARAAQVGRPLGPVSPQATYNVPTQNVPQMRAPVPQGPVAPQNLQNQVRQQAASRIVGMGGAAAVPAAVGLGGAAATGIAGGQMAAMTPEQRKAYYDNMMLGAMGGDASLAAAIMNRGQ